MLAQLEHGPHIAIMMMVETVLSQRYAVLFSNKSGLMKKFGRNIEPIQIFLGIEVEDDSLCINAQCAMGIQ